MLSNDQIQTNLVVSKSHLALVRRPGSGVVHLERVLKPVASPGDLVCRTLIAGVCGTDLQILRGVRSDPARILGHEGIAIVDEVATTADERWLGTTIAVNPTSVSGSAELGHTLEGMMQQRFVLPTRLRSHAVPAPLGLDGDLAVLAEPLASVLTCADLLQRIFRPVRVLAVGRGTIGQLLRLVLPTACPSVQYVSVTGTKERTNMEAGTFDAAVLCSSREDVTAAFSIGLSAVRDGGALYLFGGIPYNYHDPNLPEIHLSKIRARHVGGHVDQPVAEWCRTTIDNKWLAITGHRGSSNAMLSRAMLELISHASTYRSLLRIVTDPKEAIQMLGNALTNPPTRPWTKLGIDFQNW